MLIEEHLQKTVQVTLGTSPENMLKTSLETCTELAGCESGSIPGEEGSALQFLFSDVEDLIGMRAPFDSIAGITVNKNLVIYTYAPSDKRHFDGIDKQIAKQTNYLLSIPIPSIHLSIGNGKPAKNAGTLQILFNEDLFPELDVKNGAQEFNLGDFKISKLYTEKLKNVFLQVHQGYCKLLTCNQKASVSFTFLLLSFFCMFLCLLIYPYISVI